MFTPGVMVIKVYSKKQVTDWAKYLSSSERSYLACLKNAIDYWVSIFCWLCSFSEISTLNISRTVTPKSINHAISWKNLIDFNEISFSCT